MEWDQQIISGCPDVIEHQITPEDEFVVLACDGELLEEGCRSITRWAGVWDIMSNQAAVDFVRERLQAEGAAANLDKICEVSGCTA